MYRLASRDGVGLVLGRGRSGSDSLGWSENMSNRRADAAKRCFESDGGEELYNKRRNMRGADGREGHEFDRQTEMDFADDGKVRHVHRRLSVFIHFHLSCHSFTRAAGQFCHAYTKSRHFEGQRIETHCMPHSSYKAKNVGQRMFVP